MPLLVQLHFEHEVKLLRTCVHPRIIGCRGLYHGSQDLAIVLDLMPGGDCQQLLKRHGALAEPAVHTIMEQLFDALDCVHSRGILHRDVKLENVLVTTAVSPQIKVGLIAARECDTHVHWPLTLCPQLCDFGHSCHAGAIGQPDNFRGTEGYQAPELSRGSHWSTAADVFSAGVVMHALCANYLLRWSMGQPDLRGRSFQRVSTPTKLLLKMLIMLEPEMRATVPQATSALKEVIAAARKVE